MNLFTLGLIFAPLAIISSFLGNPIASFFLSALAIIPLAKFIGESTEQIAARTSSSFGGLLNATFGNATEIIIGIFALRAGLIEVVQASITGSIVANLLLVVGFSMIAGGYNRNRQTFNRVGISAVGTTLMLGAVALIMPAVVAQTTPGISDAVIGHLSVFVSLILIGAYFMSLLFSMYTHKHLYTEEVGTYEKPRWSLLFASCVLLASTVIVAWISDILVNSITPIVVHFGWTELFIGVVIVALVGNAAEHVSAVTVAIKNRMDLSLQIGMGSATQIAMFAAPLLVLISFLFDRQLSLVFNPFELVAIVTSIFVVNIVVSDGESNWLEGLLLVVAYIIIAASFFLHP